MTHTAEDTPNQPKPNPFLKWVRAHVIERTMRRLPRTADVLDLCCGYGFYFMINPDARGVDGDPEAVAACHANGWDVTLADVTKGLPFDDDSFGWVVAHDVLEHFELADLHRLAAESHRVLRPGGRFVAIVPNRKGYDFGLQTGAGHRLFVTATEIGQIAEGRFTVERNYPEPLPRGIGRLFTHNKEVFILRK